MMFAALHQQDFPIDPTPLLPAITEETRAYWEGLQRGVIVAQACSRCGVNQVPGGPVCGHCGSVELSSRTLWGAARLFAWVRYHRPYLPEFAHLLPYVSATVELEEGARLIARLVDLQGDPVIGMPLALRIERWPDGRCVPVFAPAQ